MRKLHWVAAALVLPFMTGLAPAGETTGNQILAERIAGSIKDSGQFRRYAVDVETENGIAILTGKVASEDQRVLMVNMTRQQPGVVAVVSRLAVSDSKLIPINYQEDPAPTPPAPMGTPAPVDPGAVMAPMDAGTVMAPEYDGYQGGGPVMEPAPVMNFGGGVAPYTDSPALPPYSWPAYTPYNNFASNAYQTQYPSGAWPYIGPPWPYPMIPSGWRHVSLKWKHGYWWLKFHAH